MTEQDENQICGFLFRQLKGGMAPTLYTSAVRLLLSVQRDVPDLTRPSVGCNDEFVQFAWDDGKTHVDVDVNRDGQAEWFGRCRRAETTIYTEAVADDPVPTNFVEWLGKVTPYDSSSLPAT